MISCIQTGISSGSQILRVLYFSLLFIFEGMNHILANETEIYKYESKLKVVRIRPRIRSFVNLY